MASKKSRQIWKFALATTSSLIRIPKTWRAISAQMQDGTLTMWAIVDPDAPKTQVNVKVVGTGWPENLEGWQFLSTVQDGEFVWHVFVPEQAAN